MKKILIYIIVLFCIIFLLPSIFTKKRQDVSTAVSEVEEQEENETEEVTTAEKESYDYSQYATIKLYHTETGEIEEISLDEYLYGVVSRRDARRL